MSAVSVTQQNGRNVTLRLLPSIPVAEHNSGGPHQGFGAGSERLDTYTTTGPDFLPSTRHSSRRHRFSSQFRRSHRGRRRLHHPVTVVKEGPEPIGARGARLMADRPVGAQPLLGAQPRHLGEIVWRGLICPIKPVAPQQVGMRAPREQRLKRGIVMQIGRASCRERV